MILKAQIDTPIPVSISTFDATSANNYNKHFWKTVCSRDHANFETQRSYNGNDYSTINKFTADKLRCQQPFYFSDSNVNQLSGRVFYRLKVGDIDGRVYNSKTITVLTNGKGVEINGLVPSIVSTSSNLSVSSTEILDASISIISVLGTPLYSKNIRLNKGVNSIDLNLETILAGKYWLILRNSKYQNKTVQFLKQ